jgi:hypothetical protein
MYPPFSLISLQFLCLIHMSVYLFLYSNLLWRFFSLISLQFLCRLHLSISSSIQTLCDVSSLFFSSHLYSKAKSSRNVSWKASIFTRPDYVMPSLLAFLLPTKGERFPHLAVDSFNAITGRTVSTDWMGRVPASVAYVARGMSHTASPRPSLFTDLWRISLPSSSLGSDFFVWS